MMWKNRLRSECAGLAAIEVGSGPPVVLLHGVGLRAEAWNAQIGPLAQHCRVIALDLPGHGESALPRQCISVSHYTALIASVLARLKEKAVMFGHSMGAMIALELAAQRSDQVRGVAALNAVFERTIEAAKAVQARAANLDADSGTDPTATLERWFGRDESAEREACARWLRSVEPAAYKSAYTAFAQSKIPSGDALARLTCPSLFMTGALEPNSTPQMSKRMAEIAPNSRAIIIEGAAHMMPMTHPVEVTDVLLEFLQEVFP